MESQLQMNNKAHPKRRSAKKEKLTLEVYIDVLHTHQTLDLTMNLLNQIIRIHGFKKIYKVPKKVLVDAVDTLDLMDLPRSTLSQSVSSFAALTVEDAAADLSELNWQECCVTSIQSFSSCKENVPVPSAQNLQDADRMLINSSIKRLEMLPKRKKKRSSADALGESASPLESVSLASC